MFIKQLSIFIANRKGRLAEITQLIADEGIDLKALSIADTESYGILRVIVDNPDEVSARLKELGLTVKVNRVLEVLVPDRAGGLAGLLRLLTDNNIEVEYMYGFAVKSDTDRATMILRVNDTDRALQVLENTEYFS